MIDKAAASSTDAVCLDLEDSVVPEQKGEARAVVVRALRDLDFGVRTRMVRINALDTPFAYRDVIDLVEAAGDRVDVIMLPKTRGPGDVAFLDTLLTQVEQHCALSRRIGIEAQIESASGYLWVREIAQASARLESLIFGAGDFAASMRMPSSGIGVPDANDALYPGHRWHGVMHLMVAAARANGLRCIDGPYAAHQDLEGFERACQIARALGFDGKQCIHPAQLAIAATVFSPSSQEVAYARGVVSAAEEAARLGDGAVSLDGTMIDMASVRMARVVLEQNRQIQPDLRPGNDNR
jgi:citrate lyase subunit beta/citryl-CoA lyase